MTRIRQIQIDFAPADHKREQSNELFASAEFGPEGVTSLTVTDELNMHITLTSQQVRGLYEALGLIIDTAANECGEQAA